VTADETAVRREGAPPAPASSVHQGIAARWLRPQRIVTLVVIVVLIVLPFSLGAGNLDLAVNVLIMAIGALGLEVLIGRTGQVSLGHAFFLGIGAYTAGKLGTDHHLNALIWIPAAGVIAGVVGGLVGPTALRLRGLYLGIVTIGLLFIGSEWIFPDWTWLTGGPGGRAIAPPRFGSQDFTAGARLGGLTFSSDGLYYYLALVILGIGMVYVHNLHRSRVGRGMLAVRDRELAAAVVGVNVARTKETAFIVSSALAGICGSLYGAHLSFVVPTDWNLELSITFVVAIVVGGMGSLWGPLLGAFVVVGLPQLLQNASSSLPLVENSQGNGGVVSTGDAANFIFGVLLIVFLIVEPRGVVGLGSRIAALAGRLRRAPAGTAGHRGSR